MVKNLLDNTGDRFDPWVEKIPWRRKWLPTPVVLSGKSCGQRSPASESPLGCKRVTHDQTTTKEQLENKFKQYTPFAVLWKVKSKWKLKK